MFLHVSADNRKLQTWLLDNFHGTNSENPTTRYSQCISYCLQVQQRKEKQKKKMASLARIPLVTGLLLHSTTTYAFAPLAASRNAVHQSSHALKLSSSSTSIDGIETDLKSLGMTQGLCDALVRDSIETHQRFWIMDNSGSMSNPDGIRYVQSSANDASLFPCTRWKELQETAIYHSQLAGFLQVPTEFQFLNSPGPFQKSFVVKNQNDALKAQQTIQRAEPIGATPLTSAVNGVRKKIEGMLPKITKTGTRVSLVIATDGLPTDTMGYGGEEENMKFGKALGSLAGLPVSTVIRLCTDDEQVVKFYNSLDGKLELSIDVLDDFVGEAKEVNSNNKWLTYGLPLHRFREGGFRCRLADLLDERKLTKDELREFTAFMFGESLAFDGLPDPQVDWDGFQKALHRLQAGEDKVYNPISKKMMPWIQLPAMGALTF